MLAQLLRVTQGWPSSDYYGAETKYEIAQAVAGIIPAFKHRLPPIRKIWQSEDERQSLFDAASLGIAYYVTTNCHEAKPWFRGMSDTVVPTFQDPSSSCM